MANIPPPPPGFTIISGSGAGAPPPAPTVPAAPPPLSTGNAAVPPPPAGFAIVSGANAPPTGPSPVQQNFDARFSGASGQVPAGTPAPLHPEPQAPQPPPGFPVTFGDRTYYLPVESQDAADRISAQVGPQIAQMLAPPSPTGPTVPTDRQIVGANGQSPTADQVSQAHQSDINAAINDVLTGAISQDTRANRPTTAKIGDWVGDVAHGLPFVGGFADDAAAGLDYIEHPNTGETFAQRKQWYAGQQAAHQAESPVSSTLLQLGTGLAGLGATRSLSFTNGATPSVGGLAPALAADGFVQGGLQGLGQGTTATQRLTNAGVGAGIGGGAGFLLGAAAAPLANRSIVARAPTGYELRNQSQALYDAADAAGLRFETVSADNAMRGIVRDAVMDGLDPSLHPNAYAAARRLWDAPTAPTLREFDTLRQVVGDAAASKVPGESRLATHMRNSLDDYLNSLGPADVLAGNPVAASAAITGARRLWSQQARSQIIDNAMGTADLSAATRSGRPADALATAFRTIANNPSLMRGFSADEQDLIRNVARGNATERTLQGLSRLAPGSSTIGSLAAGGLFFSGQHTAGLATAVAPWIAGRLAGASERQGARALGAIIRSGGTVQANPAYADVARLGALTAPAYVVGLPGTQQLLGGLVPGYADDSQDPNQDGYGVRLPPSVIGPIGSNGLPVVQ